MLYNDTHFSWYVFMKYSRYSNIREVLILVNVARRTNSRIQESRENYYYKRATKQK